jgi:hypothetical protein
MQNKQFFLATLLLLLCGCNNNTIQNEKLPEQKKTKLEQLSQFYKPILFDTLDVYTSTEEESNSFKFKGIKLDSLNAHYLNDQTFWMEGVFACYRFSINDTLVALITRVPSYYVSSAVSIFIFNSRADSVIGSQKLADVFGDAGDGSQYSTCVMKQNNQLVTCSYGWASYDHRAGDDPKDTLVDYWHNYSITRFNQNQFDTLSTDSATIVKQHKQIIKRLVSYSYK